MVVALEAKAARASTVAATRTSPHPRRAIAGYYALQGHHPGARVWVGATAVQTPRSSQGGPDTAHPEDLDVPDATFASPDLTTFCRLDKLGLHVVGQRLEPDRAVHA